MSVTSKVLLSIFIPIAFFLLITGTYILFKIFFLKKYSNFYKEIEKILDNEPYIEYITSLRTVDRVLQKKEIILIEEIRKSSNNRIATIEEKLAKINDDKEMFGKELIKIQNKIDNLRRYKDDLYKKLDNSKVFSCYSIYKKIQFEKKEIDELSLKIQKETSKLINPVHDFINQKDKYQKIFSRVLEEIEKWKKEVNFKRFNDNLEKKIASLNESFEQSIKYSEAGDEELLKWFTLFKKELYNLIVFDNYYEKFRDFLFKKSTATFSKIDEYVAKVKENIGIDSYSKNIDQIIDNIYDEYNRAKDSFYKLDIENTKLNIEQYHKSLLLLIHELSIELNAFNYYKTIKPIDDIDYFRSWSLKRQEEIHNQTSNISNIDSTFYWNIWQEYDKLKKSFSEINENINSFKEMDSSNEVLFSKKIQTYKIILSQFETFLNDCNDIEKSIEIFYNEGASQGAKYHRLKKIFINCLSELKTHDIELTDGDKNKIQILEAEKQKIDNHIISQNSNSNEKEFKDFVDKFYNLVSDFLLTVQKKVVILYSFNLINLEYSTLRISNEILNEKFSEAETLIMKGEYEKGLVNLINIIKGVGN